ARDLLDRLLERVCLVVERVLRLLQVVLRRARPVGDLLRGLLAIRRVRRAGVVDSLDERVGRLDGALQPGADESPAALGRLGLRLGAGVAERRGRAEVLDDRLDLATPDPGVPAGALRPTPRLGRS